ncbi:pickpocket protein 19 [Fopius arisanus]|uniref:Pickpocket protein 19 n=2 Tax=Fopius arisanus TaxID=64838 RepID=A0A9R1TEU6_9HYME|nr:PREDICTED: pickpocket protein 19 [Fopius arisanus]
MEKRPPFLWRLFKQYLENSSIHGFKYLVEPERHWTERLFWTISCGASIWACGLMVINTITFALSRDVSITMGTNYLEYEAEIPALHFCADINNQAIETVLDYPQLGVKAEKIPTEEELTEIMGLIQPRCGELLEKCLWNDEEIDCCELFFPLQSNSGLCLSSSSVQTMKPGNKTGLRLVMDHRKQEGRLTVLLKSKKGKLPAVGILQAWLTNRYEYPTSETSLDKRVELKERQLIVVDVTAVGMKNQREVIEMPMSKRKCRMSSETGGNLYMKRYNYNGCLMEHQMRNMHRMFGCISHIFPRIPEMRVCNVSELVAGYLFVQGVKSTSQADCLPDCEGIVYDFSLNKYETENFTGGALMQIEVNMLPGPSIQYERYATRSLLQVIISVGSVVSLFMGASLLSFIEIPYWLLIRTNI